MNERVADLLGQLTLEEKVSLTSGVDHWHTPPVERVGLPSFKMSDGPIGVRGARNPGGPPSACFPCGTALAASWDVELIEGVGRQLGIEARAKNVHLLLGPTVNIHRHPLAGRNFECYSEDPLLTAHIASAYIRGIQSTGVGACIKHLVANDSEFERHTISSEVPERALREVYLRPFELALSSAQPVAVMGAYNKLRGTWCCEHSWLLTDVLRTEWSYEGLVVSDWWAVHSTSEAVAAGLDLEMPGPSLFRGDTLSAAVRNGSVAEASLDRMVAALLRAMERTGALEDAPAEESAADTPERRSWTRKAAAAGIVLLKNDGVDAEPLLPLSADLKRVAVVGPNADAVTILGGGSAAVTPYRVVSPLDALRAALPGATVIHEPGAISTRYPPLLDMRHVTSETGEATLRLEFRNALDGSSHALAAGRAQFDMSPHPFGADVPWSARIDGSFVVPESGEYRFQVAASGGVRAWIRDEVLAEAWEPAAGRHERVLSAHAGEELPLVVEYRPGGPRGNGLEVRCERILPADALERAVEAAAGADLVIAVVGTNADTETEGRDRRSLDLPGNQDDLVRRVAEVNPRTVVVLNTGSPVAMPWLDEVPAVVQMWFAGQECGAALADVLLGEVEPNGRLPTTFPRRLEDTPAFTTYPGEGGQVHYGEGVFVGYRWYDRRGITPLFPFGHGLSYTTFRYDDVEIGETADVLTVNVRVTNIGGRRGTEVVQVYVGDHTGSVMQPPKQLAGFVRLELDPGETATGTVTLGPEAFSYWDVASSSWAQAKGDFEVLVGSSSSDIRATRGVRR